MILLSQEFFDMAVKDILAKNFSIEDRFIPNYTQLQETICNLRKLGMKIAMTQGTWDMFHPGHALYIVRAKEDERADILVAVVDTDELTRVRKGPRRPFDVLQERVIVTCSQRAVDIVTVKYKTDHPHHVIEIVKPDVLIVSQRVEDIKQEDRDAFERLGCKLINLPGQASVSTTAKLRRVRKEGAEILAQQIKQVVDHFVQEYLEGATEEEVASQLGGENVGTEQEELGSIFSFIEDWKTRRQNNGSH